MSYSEPLSLRSILVRLFHRRPDTERLVEDLHLDPGQIAWDARPVNTWHSILLEVDRLGRIDDLVRKAVQLKPEDEQLARFIAQYRDIDWRSELYAVGRRFVWAVPDALPPNYVPRPELLAEVRKAILADTDTLALTSAIKMDALHGMGGIGKSVIARALCDDPEVQAAFPDGILWARVGQTPDLIPQLSEWIDALGGMVSEIAPTVDRLKAILADLLRERACLLIADDVWKKTHAEVFRVGGQKCRLLLTTRDAALAEELGADVHPIPVMAEAEAIDLLEEWAGDGLFEADTYLRARIVQRLGRLPLAIKLAGAQLQRKDPQRWLEVFDATKLMMRRVEEIHDSLAATFALSLDALNPTDRRLYVSLCIFREGEPTPVVAIAKLWSATDKLDYDGSAELLIDLAARALLQHSKEDSNAVTIHDLLRDFMVAELGASGQVTAHQALLDAYRQIWDGDGWHTLSSDGYIDSHLAWHMEQAKQSQSIHSLLREQDRVGRNGWFELRDSLGQITGYLEDVARAERLARAHFERDRYNGALGLLGRCALLKSSVRTLASNIPPALLLRLVQLGLWTPVQSLAYARQSPWAPQRARALALLLGELPAKEQEALIEEIWELLGTMQSNDDQAEVLRVFIPKLPYHLVAPCSRLLHTELPSEIGVSLQINLIARIAELGHGIQALHAIQDLKSEDDQAHALMIAVEFLPDDLLSSAQLVASSINSRQGRVAVKVMLLARLSDEDSEELRASVMRDAEGIVAKKARIEAIMALLPWLSGDQRDQMLREARRTASSLFDVNTRDEFLARLAAETQTSPQQELSQQALHNYDAQLLQEVHAVLALSSEQERFQALDSLAGTLPRSIALEVLQSIRRIGDAASLEAVKHQSVEGETIRHTRQFPGRPWPHSRRYDFDRDMGLPKRVEEAVRQLPLDEVLRLVFGSPDRRLWPFETSLQFEKRKVHEFDDWLGPEYEPKQSPWYHLQGFMKAGDSSLIRLLLWHIPRLFGSDLERAIDAVIHVTSRLTDTTFKATSLGMLLPYSRISSQWESVSQRLLQHIAETPKDEDWQAAFLVEVIPQLPGSLYQKIDEIIATFSSISNQLDVISAMPNAMIDNLLEKAANRLLQTTSEQERRSVLSNHAEILARLPGDLAYRIWIGEIKVWSEHARAELVASIEGMAPLTYSLGGEEALDEISNAVIDVGRWWP